jgi:hypothetical protein
MTIQAKANLYTGINPHLMSFLQTVGVGITTSTYPSFHSDHITHIKDFLNDALPPQYIALTEPSLQIQSRSALDETFSKESQPSPDVAIYQSQERPTITPVPQMGGAPTLQLEMQLEEPKTLMSVAIYEFRVADHTVHGTPIVRIELLSPANMLGGSYAEAYAENRAKCLLAETTLVEIDYLHEYTSPVKGIPHYPTDAQSKPYNISVTHPKIKKVDVYLFGINEPIPTVTLPLTENDFISFDFGLPYDFTWQKSRFWFYVDYTQPPLRMETYSPQDQQAIYTHMQAIAQQHKPNGDILL